MKKALIISCFAISSIGLSQERDIFQKGTKSLGLENVSFGYGGNNYNIGGGLSYGQFISKRIALGVEVENRFAFPSGSHTIRGYGFTVAPSAKYYFSNLDKRIVFYGKSEVSYSHQKYNFFDQKHEWNTIGGALSIGTEYFLNKKLSFFGEVGYQINKDLQNKAINHGIKLNAGVRYYLNGTKKKKDIRALD